MRDGGAVARSRALHDLVRILAEADTVQDAARRSIQALAEAFAWVHGAFWLVGPDARLLQWDADWPQDAARLADFRRVSRRLTFAPGVGLPGRAWASGTPVWVVDVGADEEIPRRREALAAGLRSAVALPVGGPQGILGVIELFGPGPREPDADQVEVLRTSGAQMGQYLARRQAEERLLATEEIHSAVVRAALDCVVTMDHRGLVVDFNPAAESTFGFRREEAVGRELADLLVPPELRAAHRAALRRCVETGEGAILNRRLELVGQRADGTTLPVELTIARLGRREPPLFAGFLRDITERHRARDELADLLVRERAARVQAEAAERATRVVAQTLQRTLLPPHLPAIPGIELGAAYRAGGEGLWVGGDFYDVFPLGPAGWGVAIGDVQGKGAHAASVTALVRYTLRTAAVREPSPRAVLETLNDALLRQDPLGDHCTAIFALLAPAAAGTDLTLAIGGHLAPLLARDGGDVEAVGRSGTLLGAVPDPVLIDASVALRCGDALLLYTDGVTETRTADGRFGTERLAALLSKLRGEPAASIAGAIEAAVVEAAVGPVADDVALLVLRVAGDAADASSPPV